MPDGSFFDTSWCIFMRHIAHFYAPHGSLLKRMCGTICVNLKISFWIFLRLTNNGVLSNLIFTCQVNIKKHGLVPEQKNRSWLWKRFV